MIQKVFRFISMFMLLALILSPLYSKHVRHYFSRLRLVETNVKNLNQVIPGSDKVCDIEGAIKIPADNYVQVLHVLSASCKICLEDSKIWSKLPDELHKYLQGGKKQSRIEIVNLIDNKSFESQVGKDMFTETMSDVINNNVLQDKLKSVKITVCGGVIDNDVLEAMRLDIFPTTIVLKNGEIVHVSSGKIYREDLEKLSGVLSAVRK